MCLAKDKAEKSFAMSYIRLMNDDGTTLSDTMHDLLVYKVIIACTCSNLLRCILKLLKLSEYYYFVVGRTIITVNLYYQLDTKKADESSNGYLKLPSTQKELQVMSQSGQPLKPNNISTGSLSLSTSDSFQICTLICSTKLTHNGRILHELKSSTYCYIFKLFNDGFILHL